MSKVKHSDLTSQKTSSISAVREIITVYFYFQKVPEINYVGKI
jgi:hypothetical protein